MLARSLDKVLISENNFLKENAEIPYFTILSSVQTHKDENPEKQNTDILMFPKVFFTLLK